MPTAILAGIQQLGFWLESSSQDFGQKIQNSRTSRFGCPYRGIITPEPQIYVARPWGSQLPERPNSQIIVQIEGVKNSRAPEHPRVFCTNRVSTIEERPSPQICLSRTKRSKLQQRSNYHIIVRIEGVKISRAPERSRFSLARSRVSNWRAPECPDLLVQLEEVKTSRMPKLPDCCPDRRGQTYQSS